MIARLAVIMLELAALGSLYVLLRWANRKIDEQLVGAQPTSGDNTKARTGAAAQESPLECSTTPARAPSAIPHPLRWPVSLYVPCASGFVAHQFEVEGELGAAHVALYRVPRLGMEPRA